MELSNSTMDTLNISEETLPENPFNKLPEDALSEIFGRTSPRDASRFALVSKQFKSAADSNTTWRIFLAETIALCPKLNSCPSVKKLYFLLCTSPLHGGGSGTSLFLEKETGKKCLLLRHIDVATTPGTTRRWRWLHVNFIVDIGPGILSQGTEYGAYLVFEDTYDNYPSNGEELFTLWMSGETGSHLSRLTRAFNYDPILTRGGGDRRLVKRDDKWKELEFADFVNDSPGPVVMKFHERTKIPAFGFTVKGVELRPRMSSKHCKSG